MILSLYEGYNIQLMFEIIYKIVSKQINIILF